IDYRAAIALYDRLLTRHRGFSRYDLVLYMKAFALLELGARGTSLELYRRIIREFPESRFVPDAHFALAEAKFEVDADFEAALREYELVMQHEGSELYDISLFKSAWCLWRLGRNQDAALRFRQVLDLGAVIGSNLSEEKRRRLSDLQDEALDYLIQVFIEDESNTAADFFAFLREIGGEQYANRVLRRLSDTYLSQSRFDRAIEAYRLLLAMDAAVPEAPDYQRIIARAHSAMGDMEGSIRELRLLAQTYAPGSRWANQQNDPRLVARAARRTERAIRTRALRLHQEGQRESQRPALERAVELYALHHEHFSEAEEAYRLQFYRAEILFHRLERYPEAGDVYLAAARMKPRGEYTRDALYNAIGAFERVRERELDACAPGGQRQGGASGEACAETENDQKFSGAIELYVEFFPQDPDLPEILFRQGRLYYDRGVYDPAVRL
ncbi:MAG: tetratricopeptide repeat protein, partial [Polyangiaceae bacterium]|nr:tetratricopeptide repeat protein [Polyangiaceae bacterium]